MTNPTGRLSMVACSILGAFAIHCSSEHLPDGTPSDGYVTDAAAEDSGSADTCCAPTAPVFTKLSAGDLPAHGESPVIDVSAYREVVLYGFGCGTTTQSPLRMYFASEPGGVFQSTGQSFVKLGDGTFGGRVRVDGPQLKLDSSCGIPMSYQVVGVR